MRKLFSYVFLSLLVITFVGTSNTFAQNKSGTQQAIQEVYDLFEAGNYDKTIERLTIVEQNIIQHTKRRKDIKGLIEYWRGLAYARMNEFPLAIKHFEAAIELKYKAKDLYYEYGQALYVSEKLKRARIAFKKSVKRRYKMGVSLYYIGFISQQLKDYKKAVSFYNTIEKLPEEEKKDVIQAARMQVGDIYYEQIRRRPNIFGAVEKYVIPQYEKALEWDEESSLAPEIQAKIDQLKQKYDLELYKMRNGRITARPPYFMKVNTLFGNDDNVNTLDADSIAASSDEVGANYYSLGFFGRYSFYPNSTYIIAPELRASKTKYISDVENIYANDNYMITLALKINYEKTYNNAPATTYIDLDYTTQSDDSDADETLEQNYTQLGVTISEERQFWLGNPTTLRFKFSQTTDETPTESFNSIGVVWEQLIMMGSYTLYLYNSLDLTRFPDAEAGDTNALTMRGDFIFPTFFGLFNPSLYAATTQTSYANDDDRENASLITLGFNLNRPISRKWYLTFDYSNNTQSSNTEGDNYKQQRMSINLDYVY
jgi:tetratricopeptide (TPR) repeat protein